MKKWQWLRWGRQLLGGSLGYGGLRPFVGQARAFDTAVVLVRVFYVATFFRVTTHLAEEWLGWLGSEELAAIWPTAWVEWVGIELGVNVIATAAIVSALLTLLMPEKRVWRAFTFGGFFMMIGLTNSFGKINHSFHVWLFALFFLIFLPNRPWEMLRRSVGGKHRFLTVFWYTQFFVLLTYSMSGFWKLGIGMFQLLFRDASIFSSDGLALLVSTHLLKINGEALLGWFIIENPWVGFLPFLGVVYLELFAVFAAFRPEVQRFWAVSLMLFHMGTNLLMTINFNNNILVVGIFLLLSPFAPATFDFWRTVRSLPLVDVVMAMGKRDREGR